MNRISLISLFARHRVAANLLMVLLILLGLWSLSRINTQFLPTFKLTYINVNVAWPSATAFDIEQSIIIPLEKELRDVDELKEISSVSREGYGTISLEFNQDADMAHALEQVKERVALVRNLPQDSEPPIIQRIIRYEPIARIIITAPYDLAELRPLVHQFERELLDRGIAKIDVTGLPEQEIAIQVPIDQLLKLNLSLDQIADLIRNRSADLPAGDIGSAEVAKQLRSPGQIRKVEMFDQLPLITDAQGRLIRLGDVAIIEQRPQDQSVLVSYQNKPAVQMQLLRSETSSALGSANILTKWLAQVRPELSKGIQLHVFDENWHYIKQRIDLLIRNGITGFVLILLVLFLFLNRNVAFWVAMGIPISILTALAVLYATGGSINMVSLFAFIMTLGIIVDDTIVVGEETLSLIQSGTSPGDAVELGAKRMLPPIMASSLTTIAAFIPLMLIQDVIGKILIDIPFVVICVILASLVESFLILPGHLRHSFRRSMRESPKQHPWRKKIDEKFFHFRDHFFRRVVLFAEKNHWLVISSALALFIITMGLVFSGKVNFTFFPSPDGSTLRANVEFVAGTPESTIKQFLQQVEQGLHQADQQLTKNAKSIVLTTIAVQNQLAADRSRSLGSSGEEYAHVLVELSQPDDREVRNDALIKQWYQNVRIPPAVESFTITAPRAGPPGQDIDVALTADNPQRLKQAAINLTQVLSQYNGVSSVKDDLPFGQEQLIFQLKPQAQTLGLTLESVGQQLRAALSGKIVQIVNEPNEEIEVRVLLPDVERDQLQTLEQLPIITPQGNSVPLDNVITIDSEQSLSVLKHTNTLLTARVSAEVNPNVANANKIIEQLKQTIIPTLQQEYGVNATFKGRAEEQQKTLTDMKYGLILALVLIYIILAWVFSSYFLPILILLAIPLGLTGAVLGHWLMGIDLTVLSLFGFFGLSGIVINDSIILVRRYLELCKEQELKGQAIVDASCQRLRPVLLTSLTTIVGLLPLLFERSLQAQFLIPMAVSLAFGLAYATILVLIVVPALLSIYHRRVA